MSAVIRKLNIHVAVEARPLRNGWWLTGQHLTREEIEQHLIAGCNQIMSEVKRHVDDIYGVAVVYDSVKVCGFCEEPWDTALVAESDATDEEPFGWPICCDAAQDEWIDQNNDEATK